MKIEVACRKDDSTKVKGDLLESLSKDLLEAQGYNVIEEIRFTGVELDLLCKHRVSKKEIYVECKAQKDKIGAPILRQLLGTVMGYEYSEGWIISTSDFGKEAKGFVEMWNAKPQEQSSKLSFYTPDAVIEALLSASIVCKCPEHFAENYIGDKELLGEWTLLITTYGRFWTVYTLEGGAPSGVLIFSAKSGKHIQDTKTIDNITLLETTLSKYNLKVGIIRTEDDVSTRLPNVVEVQIGDSWNDYRPARPQDFIGRDSTQKEILDFFEKVKDKRSDTRIFSITGNSGLGKSSLIAKVRDKSRNKYYKNRYFTFAVDIRGAKTPSYISASLLKCLQNAQESGFGEKINLQLTNPSAPLSSPSIIEFLESVERKGQIICLIFDQFEELYSKPELFGVFTAAKDLMLDVSSFKGNIILGFAWKTDSTTQQDHPAYHMWHELSDFRRVYQLDVFNKGDIAKAITTFEKEIGQKIPIETRHQIAHSSQGFPWLLKKLCINVYENLQKEDGSELIFVDLDVRRLFENDLNLLSPTERTCLQIIAQNAPADWSEIIETSGIATLNKLVNKRLVIKSGDRLNIYWDIFKDYLLTKRVPVIPFNYIPTSDISSMLNVSNVLSKKTYLGADMIANQTSLNETTVGNIGADLVMLGIAERKGTSFKYHRDLDDISEKGILEKLRDKFDTHALKISLYKTMSGKTINQELVTETLKTCLPNAVSSEKTWKTYTNRLSKILINVGYALKVGKQITIQDIGTPDFDNVMLRVKGRQTGLLFSATASPASVCELLKILEQTNNIETLVSSGYRNTFIILRRFKLISLDNDNVELNMPSINKYGGYKEAVWSSAKNEVVIAKCIDILEHSPEISGPELGALIAKEYDTNWTDGTIKRNGNSLKQWAKWVKDGIDNSEIPTAPGRAK